MNIAIFGGSFDPFHIGHEKIIKSINNNLKIDKLFIIPTYLNPFKKEFFLEAKTRLDLIQQNYEDDENIEIISYEVDQNKSVYTYETIQYLKKQYSLNKIYLIIGADNLKDVHLWYNFQKLKSEVEFIVFSRDNISLKNKYIDFITIKLNENISSSQLRKKMDINYIPKKIQNKVKKLWKIE